MTLAKQLKKSEHDRDGDLRPSAFVAVHRISATSGATLARQGASCGRVPRYDLEWLSKDGHIKLKGDRDTWRNIR